MRCTNKIFLPLPLYCLVSIIFMLWSGKGYSETNPQRPAASGREAPYTLDDRDRMIRIEAEQKSIRNEMQSIRNEMQSIRNELTAKLESQQQQINDIKTLLYFILGGLFGLVGLILWDRRSYIKPVKEDIRQLYAVLRELARTDEKVAQVLRQFNLL